MEINEDTGTRGEQVKDGRVLIDQNNGCINIYDESGRIVVKIGNLGLDDNNSEIYGAAVYDENGIMRALFGKQTGGY